jgi:hypothetical protein
VILHVYLALKSARRDQDGRGGRPDAAVDGLAAQAIRILGSAKPYGAARQARIDLAADILADMRRLHEQMLESKKKLASAVRAPQPVLAAVCGLAVRPQEESSQAPATSLALSRTAPTAFRRGNMSQPASPGPWQAPAARHWPAPAPPAPARHRPRARRWISAACLTLTVLLTPAVQLTAWAEGTLLSASGFTAALGTLPRNPAVQAQITTQIDRQLQRAGTAKGTPHRRWPTSPRAS